MRVKQGVKRALRRMFPGLAAPTPPFAARDSALTMIFSLDDEPHQPSERLLALSADAIRAASEIRLEGLRSRTPPACFDTWPGEHYRLLSALVAVLQPRVVVEIGTFAGLSALAMKETLPAGSRLATFDIYPWHAERETLFQPADFEDGTLVQHIDDLADPQVVDRHRELLEEAGFILIDGPHDGETEARMIAGLRRIRFRSAPVLMFDDIRLWSMLKFWRELSLPKLDLTSFGHWSGTGLAEWTGEEL